MARPAPAVDRTVAVLNLLAAHPDTAFSLSEMCRRLDINKATAHAMLTALADSGFLLRNPRDKSYTLGPALIALGSAAAARRLELVEFARAPMQQLAAETGLQCVVSSAMGEEIVFLAVAGEVVPFGPHVRVGQRIPLSPPIGTVFMAWSLPDEVDTWLDRSPPASPWPNRNWNASATASARCAGADTRWAWNRTCSACAWASPWTTTRRCRRCWPSCRTVRT